MLDVLFGHAGSALEQTGVQVEHVAGIGFTTRRTTQQQGNLTVGPGLLGQIVIDDQGVLTAVAEVLAHRATGVRSDVLHRGGLGGGRGDDDGVFHRAVFFELAHHVRDGRSFLTDRNVDTHHVFALLVDDRINRNGSLTGLTVADDQLALATTDGDHGVHRLQAGLHRLGHRLTPDDARSDLLDRLGQLGVDRALAIDRLTQGVNDATDQLGADRDFQNATGTLDGITFGDAFVFAQHHGANGVALEVHGETEDVAGEFQHFALHGIGQAVDTADTVSHRNHGTFGTGIRGQLQVLNPTLDQVTDFRGVKLHSLCS